MLYASILHQLVGGSLLSGSTLQSLAVPRYFFSQLLSSLSPEREQTDSELWYSSTLNHTRRVLGALYSLYRATLQSLEPQWAHVSMELKPSRCLSPPLSDCVAARKYLENMKIWLMKGNLGFQSLGVERRSKT